MSDVLTWDGGWPPATCPHCAEPSDLPHPPCTDEETTDGQRPPY